MRREHGILTPEQLADRQETLDRTRIRQEIDAQADAALKAYRAPFPVDNGPMVPLAAFVIVAALCIVLIVYILS